MTHPTPPGTTPPATMPPLHPSLSELVRVFARIGVFSFGGPAGQIAMMHRELVDERRWISERRFLHALNYCMLLPGPEAQQLATYIGWLLHGARGGILAGTLFVLPGFVMILGLSAAYALFQETGWLASLFFGLKAAVLAIVVEAVIRVGRRTLKTGFSRLLAAAAFLALFVLQIPFPIVIVIAGVLGVLRHRLSVRAGGQGEAVAGETEVGPPAVIGADFAMPAPEKGRTIRLLALWGGLWALPILIAALFAKGIDSVYVEIGTFFSRMAVVTFGGAYAVLAYVAQQAVENYHWLKPGEMLDGLALAETTPGPLVLVLTFVGFLAAFRDAGGLDPLVAGLLGATLATWVTFIPCFLWIFLGAPHVERLRSNRLLSAALEAISAAVAGVILNLAVWFALHVLFASVIRRGAGPVSLPVPEWATLDLRALALALLSALLILYFKRGVPLTLALAALAGWLTAGIAL